MKEQQPINMILHCPSCGKQHVDKVNMENCETCGRSLADHKAVGSAPTGECVVFSAWINPPHKSHLCHGCGTVWRPADVPTNGVEKIETRGERDTWPDAATRGGSEIMHFSEFSKINKGRCESVEGFNHRLDSWSLSDWFTATLGELGEAANIAKKLNRVRDGIPGNGDATEAELRQQLADEIADTFIYLDLLAQSVGVNLGSAVIWKFNKTSQKVGFPYLIATTRLDGAVEIVSGEIKNETD